MSGSRKLTSEQRQFFADVVEAAFANPFSPEREALNHRITGITLPEQRLLEEVLKAIDERLAGLRDDLQAFKDPLDRAQLQTACLFQIYHEYQPSFDRFIEQQAEAGDAPIPLPFAQEILERLYQLGLEGSECARYLGLFYQLRRAAGFIRSEISGQCPSIVRLRMRLWNAIFTFRSEWYLMYLCGKMEDFSTLLLGETGTGKSAAARAIGLAGFIPFDLKTRSYKESFTRSFISINLAQYPAGLIESELFGHKKGAFTGAIENHPGIFARCSPYGAVFIDEIGDVDLPAQLKLLTVLQERTFSPVGSHSRLRFAGRVIAATNKDIDELRARGLIRDDFYYRLCSDVLTLPPLRQRLREDPGELRIILEALIKKAIGEFTEPLVEMIEARIGASLPKNYAWPGNVRELEQCVRRICLTGQYRGDSGPGGDRSAFLQRIARGDLSAAELLSGYCRQLYERAGTYEEVARLTGLDRRTVKKYLLAAGPLEKQESADQAKLSSPAS